MIHIVYIIFLAAVFSQDSYGDYFGGWPVNNNKDEIKDPGFEFECNTESSKKEIGCPCLEDSDCITRKCFKSPKIGGYCLQQKGTLFPRYTLTDQYGEKIDIYDFSNQGKSIVIELSTSWCRPCRELAAWLSYGDDSIEKNRWWKKEYSVIKDLIEEGQIYFINIQIQDQYREPASLESLEDWFQQYPDEKIPVLADSNYDVRNWVRVTGYPSVILLNEKMEIIQFSLRGWHDTFNLLANFNQNFKKTVE